MLTQETLSASIGSGETSKKVRTMPDEIAMVEMSKNVLRWEIENFTSLNTVRKAESSVIYNAGGFEWKIAFAQTPHRPTRIDFSLTCINQKGGNWKCVADVEFVLFNHMNNRRKQDSTTFTNAQCQHKFAEIIDWASLIDPTIGYIHDDTVIIDFRIDVISAQGIEGTRDVPVLDLARLRSPNETNNVILVIERDKLTVCKDYLAIHSPVFAAMLFKDFAEKKMERIIIEQVVYEEFLDFLHLIFSRHAQITDSNVFHILELADRFAVKELIEEAEDHLTNSSKLSAIEKLQLADQYRLTILRTKILHGYKSAGDFKALKAYPEYDSFSDNMKAAICDRVLDLVCF